MDDRHGIGRVADGEEFPPLREEDVTVDDRLDDRVAEGEEWPEEPVGPDNGRSEP